MVEICVTRVSSCIRETSSVEQHCEALVALLESCLHHNLQLSSRNEDPPHAKISSDIISCIFLVSFFYYIFYRRCNLNFKDDIFLDTIGMLKNNHIVHWLVHIENTKSVWKDCHLARGLKNLTLNLHIYYKFIIIDAVSKLLEFPFIFFTQHILYIGFMLGFMYRYLDLMNNALLKSTV